MRRGLPVRRSTSLAGGELLRDPLHDRSVEERGDKRFGVGVAHAGRERHRAKLNEELANGLVSEATRDQR